MVGRFPALKYFAAASSNSTPYSSAGARHDTSAWVWTSMAIRSWTFMGLPRREAQRAVEAHDLAVQREVIHHVQDEASKLVGVAEALRERDGRCERRLRLGRQLAEQGGLKETGRDGQHADTELSETPRGRH